MNVATASCHRCNCPMEASDLRCVVCGKAAELAAGRVERDVASVLRCNTCGAAVSYDEKERAPRCVFCSSVMQVETPDDPLEQADSFVPFAATPEHARAALQAFLGKSRFFAPSDLASRASLEGLAPIWFAAWLCDADALVSYAADTNHGAGRSAWAPCSGQHDLAIRNLLVSASRGLSLNEVAQLAPAYRIDTAQPTTPDTRAKLECYDVQRSRAREIVVKGIERQAEGNARSWLPGSSHRNLHVAVLLRGLRSRRIALPAYVLAYRYRDAVHRVVVHGQDPSRVIGSTPTSPWRVAAVVLFVLAVIAVIFGVLLAR